MNDLRPCMFKRKVLNENHIEGSAIVEQISEETFGYFHRWEQITSGLDIQVYGLCEDAEDGQIYRIEPTAIRFTDRENKVNNNLN